MRQIFVKALILQHIDLKYHILIEMDILHYAISGVFTQPTLDDLDQWYPMTFLSQKMIVVNTRYKTHDNKLLAIIKIFKTW